MAAITIYLNSTSSYDTSGTADLTTSNWGNVYDGTGGSVDFNPSYAEYYTEQYNTPEFTEIDLEEELKKQARINSIVAHAELVATCRRPRLPKLTGFVKTHRSRRPSMRRTNTVTRNWRMVK